MSEMKLNLTAEKQVKEYYERVSKRVFEQLEIAKKCKAKGFEYIEEVESIPVRDVADRTEELMELKGVAERYRTIYSEEKGDRFNSIVRIFKEILEGKIGEIKEEEKRLEKALKTALVIETEGVVVSPIDGIPEIKISLNPDGSKYVDIFYAGPIRAAGGRAMVVPLVLGDLARKILGIDRYKPTEEEVERYVEEIEIYQTECVSRQLNLTEEEIRIIAKNCPVCINGLPSEVQEVQKYRDMERISTNRIRGAMGLVATEGVGLKASWVIEAAKKLGLDWNWLEKIIKIEKKEEKVSALKPNYKYLEKIAAGRPLLSYPLAFGGFRARYGRSRNTCIMGKGINPATMALLDDFIAVGTHIKIERPGKAAQMFPCTTIEGPIVLLANGTVMKVNDYETAKKVKPFVSKILFLGDLLVSYGDFRKTAHPLIPAGYVTEWWLLELEKAVKEKKIEEKEVEEVLKNPENVDSYKAVELSEKIGIPLHPNHIHFYKALHGRDVLYLMEEVKKAEVLEEDGKISKALFENKKETKKFFEEIGLPHSIEGEKISVGKEFAFSFLKTFRKFEEERIEIKEDVLEMLSKASGIKIKDKAGTFVGARMGRPEAARERKMIGSPHVLYPIGFLGGSSRSINKAIQSSENNGNRIEAEIALMKCPKCGKESSELKCRECGEKTKQIYYCLKCGKTGEEKKCDKCGSIRRGYKKIAVDLKKEMENASKNLGLKVPETVKGVKGLINRDKVPEPLEKGILRARHSLNVFRDGTIRFELLNAPLTHFKPKEIGLSIEKAKELGYEKDCEGKELESEEQMLELFPQDIIVNEKCGDWMVRTSMFLDELLEKFYKEKPYYNAKTKEDFIGELVVGLAPHTSAGVVGRIVGYSKARLGWHHPYFITCKRRNCDGDQDSVMLLMDCLLNFSKKYLSDGLGGKMDTALVFTIALDPREIDNEVYEAETCKKYPLELYEKAEQLSSPFLESVPIISYKLGKTEQYTGFGYTHETECFDLGPKQSSYTKLATMEEKIKSQAKLQNKINAVEKKDALERVLASHFLPDIIGNSRAFSRQTFRCTKCNTKYRRIPLVGKCTSCGGNIILTIAQGSVRKYLNIAKELINQYALSDYLKQRIFLIENEINSVFTNEKMEQKVLSEYS